MRARPPEVEPNDGLATAAARMLRARVAILPVVESGRLVGMITERDVLLAVADRLSTDMVRVGTYMRRQPLVIDSDAGAKEATARMMERRARHLLVVRGDEVVGLLSVSDVLYESGVPFELLGDEWDDRSSSSSA
jgi:CBS domain-containing protein